MQLAFYSLFYTSLVYTIPGVATSPTFSSRTKGDVSETFAVILGSFLLLIESPASCGLIIISNDSADDTV